MSTAAVIVDPAALANARQLERRRCRKYLLGTVLVALALIVLAFGGGWMMSPRKSATTAGSGSDDSAKSDGSKSSEDGAARSTPAPAGAIRRVYMDELASKTKDRLRGEHAEGVEAGSKIPFLTGKELDKFLDDAVKEARKPKSGSL